MEDEIQKEMFEALAKMPPKKRIKALKQAHKKIQQVLKKMKKSG